LLIDFESDVISSLNEAQNITDFNNILNSKYESKTSNVVLKSGIVNSQNFEKDSLMRLALDNFKTSVFYGFENDNKKGSKEEFLTYLNFRKEHFVHEVESMEFIKTKEDMDILIALMYLEIGACEINLRHLDEMIKLEYDKSDSNEKLKSANACNWWCYTKGYAKCMLLTNGFQGSIAALFLFPGAQFLAVLAGMGFSWFAYDCWVDLYNKMNS
jgi:hypothetical protein